MAAVTTPADQATDLLQKLSLDSQAKTFEVADAAKKVPADSSKVVNGIQPDRSVTPLLNDVMDPPVRYLPSNYTSAGYFYGGFDGSSNEWDEHTKYVPSDGSEVAPGVYGNSGSLMYHNGYGYLPYVPFTPPASPVPAVGHDPIYGAQLYQYPAPFFQPIAPCGSYPTTFSSVKGEAGSAATDNPSSASIDSTNSKSNVIANGGTTKVNNGCVPVKATTQDSFNSNGSYGRGSRSGGIPVLGYQDPVFGLDSFQSPMPWLESPYFLESQQRSITSSSVNSSIANGNGPHSSVNQYIQPRQMGSNDPRSIAGMNASYGYVNRLYPTSKLCSHYGNAYRSGIAHGSIGYDSKINGRDWMAVDGKFKPRGRTNGIYRYVNESMDGLNELNRGPRTKSLKNQKVLTPAAVIIKGQNIPLTGLTDCHKEKTNVCLDREQYNQPDFPETYDDAKFFIIKSYSEDDVHKSIKYNVWASTLNGNKKLDGAYLDSQSKAGGCPIFLLFSVNTSGQFVGVAEMAGPVDFNKSLEYWQQDKWIGCFPVKWHIVKDVPNSLLKHITLENNENKPVTNSRDTQEVMLEQGLQILKIFKDHTSKQCILDDFDFYEDRQKRIQEKKATMQQFQKQVWNGNPTEVKVKESSASNDLLPKSSDDTTSESDKKANSSIIQIPEECKTSPNSALLKSGDTLNSVKASVPEILVSNGVANGC